MPPANTANLRNPGRALPHAPAETEKSFADCILTMPKNLSLYESCLRILRSLESPSTRLMPGRNGVGART